MGAKQLVVQDAFEMILCFAGIVLVMIHAQHQGDVFVFRRRRNDDFLHCPAQMLLGVVGVSEPPGGFNYNLRSNAVPRQRRRIFFFKNAYGLTIDLNAVAPALTLFFRLPRTESYFNRCASVLGSVRSLTATNSRFGSCKDARRTFLSNPSKSVNAYFNSQVASNVK